MNSFNGVNCRFSTIQPDPAVLNCQPHANIYIVFVLFQGIEVKFDRLDMDSRRYDRSQLRRPYTKYFGTLQISNIQFENEGVYSCLVQTPLASTERKAIVRIAGPPGPCAGK
ncbi:unnamed protein product [Protopolystoma xenopodis]|uniref:Ig-like domain-containing protein n=1 Tax=Protopolystoma xenopodis TaxID=117903 RepID=A0A3S5C0Z9_9PLAT|nr:unnamed protein product [Protopolystoma xenopodis]